MYVIYKRKFNILIINFSYLFIDGVLSIFCLFAQGTTVKEGHFFFWLNDFYEVTKLIWCTLLYSAKSGWWTDILINALQTECARVQGLPKTEKKSI